MPVSPKQSVLTALNVFANTVAVAISATGFIVLIGWQTGNTYLTSIVPGLASMKVNTAVGFVAAALSLWLICKSNPSNRELKAGRVFAVVVAIIGLLTLTQFIAGVNLGIDQLAWQDRTSIVHPGRMSPSSAVNFFLGGIALWLIPVKPRVSHLLSMVVLVISLFAISGYIFGVKSLYQISVFSSMALHTALCFALLALGILAARPTVGFMLVVVSNSAGGIVARRLMPALPVALLGLGLLRLEGEVRGFYDARFGLAGMVTLSMIVTVVLVGYSALNLYRLDLQRKLAEDAVAQRTRELEESIAQIKRLQGLVPICAWCKNIRDDEDYWHRVEDYIAKHTEARFTHGICPECAEKIALEGKKV